MIKKKCPFGTWGRPTLHGYCRQLKILQVKNDCVESPWNCWFELEEMKATAADGPWNSHASMGSTLLSILP